MRLTVSQIPYRITGKGECMGKQKGKRSGMLQKGIAICLLTMLFLGNSGNLPVQAKEADTDYVVVVTEQVGKKETIAWQPFYVSLAALIVMSGGVLHVALTRQRHREQESVKGVVHK